MEVNQSWTGVAGDTSVVRQPPQDRRIQRHVGCPKGLWEVQRSLQERERRERLPSGLGGRKGGFGKSQGRVLEGDGIRGGLRQVGTRVGKGTQEEKTTGGKHRDDKLWAAMGNRKSA